MTEKRFRKVLGLIEDSNGDLLDLSEIVDKMNQLNNENEELKKENKELREDNDKKNDRKDAPNPEMKYIDWIILRGK